MREIKCDRCKKLIEDFVVYLKFGMIDRVPGYIDFDEMRTIRKKYKTDVSFVHKELCVPCAIKFGEILNNLMTKTYEKRPLTEGAVKGGIKDYLSTPPLPNSEILG